ncbi:hypothetical protein C8J57DRAFT_1509472 [Mycena rebaudengoi]|nr:hypothetical protein C8J57DRAFT_1509472 [Mycena rebaudengoi]
MNMIVKRRRRDHQKSARTAQQPISLAFPQCTTVCHSGSDEAAGAKIWSFYIAEAKKCDKALVNSWRGDMEGILIFAGLFLANLTALVVESYKTLNPVIRVRIFSYLYYGMKQFNIHTVVELVPLLLHSSLFPFFSGVVTFLLPINTILAALDDGFLAVGVTIYTCLTILPILYHDCPLDTDFQWILAR